MIQCFKLIKASINIMYLIINFLYDNADLIKVSVGGPGGHVGRNVQ